MLIDLFLGIYFSFSFFCASYLWLTSFISHHYSLAEKLVFTSLLSVASIIILTLTLNILPEGITPTNIIILSQAYFALSILSFTFRKKPFNLPKKSFAIKNKLLLLMIFVFLIEIIVFLGMIYFFPVTEGDTLAYHLQSPPNWYQLKNLTIFPTNDLRTLLFPDNQNFLVLWNFLFFKSDVLIDLIPYAYLLFGVLVIFVFLQKLHRNSELNFIISLLYYHVVLHLVYARTFSGDIGVSTLTITSLAMIYSYFKYGKFTYFLFFSIANGLLFSIKTNGFLNVPVIYLFALFYEFFVYRKNSYRKIFSLYLFSFLFCFTLGGFQYFRNFIYFHNPFYPKEINILGFINFPGIKGEVFDVYGPNSTRMLATIRVIIKDISQGALGLQFPLFYVPSMLILFIFYFNKLTKLNLWLLVCLISSVVLFCFAVAGGPTRYFFSIGLIGIICLANLIAILKNRRLERTLFVILSIFILTVPTDGKSLSRLREFYFLSKKTPEQRQLGEIFYQSDYHFFRENIPKGVNILYLLPENMLIYPFYGPRYENRLIYANTTNTIQIEDIIKKEKIDYFIAKSKNSNLSTIFYHCDLGKGQLIFITEDKVREAVSDLLERGVITAIGNGDWVTFYKVNRNFI